MERAVTTHRNALNLADRLKPDQRTRRSQTKRHRL
jgi:hypothetical protein